MKLFLLTAVLAGSVRADSFDTDDTPIHTVYNCDKVRQDVEEANDMIGDGNCDQEVNCGPFSYDLGDCWESADDICANDDSWYTNGRENFRCSTKTGGIRIGRAGSNDDTGQAKHDPWESPCVCYEECKEIADEKGMELVAFDMYSGKCRCWSGTCSWDDSLPCRNGGDDYGVGAPNDGGDGTNPDLGNNWRCPSEIYFPNVKEDCDGQDITFLWSNLEQYIGDGFCDDGSTLNQQYAANNAANPIQFNFDCEAYDYDGGDCQLDCHESIYWATDFVTLADPYNQLDECEHGDPVAQTEFTTACDCYTFCADYAVDDDMNQQNFLFDHSDTGMCRCFFGDRNTGFTNDDATIANINVETRFCGLNSNCQIYQPNRERSCPFAGDVMDYTLGVYGNDGDSFDSNSTHDTVVSYDAYTAAECIDSAMCMENSYSHGSCFDCDRFSTDKQTDAYCTDESATYAVISNDDLDALIADGYLEGQEAEDTSTAGDNCACLNYCLSTVVEYVTGLTGNLYSTDDAMEQLNVIAGTSFAYANRNASCACYTSCPSTTACTGATCPDTATVFYSTVADLNVLE